MKHRRLHLIAYDISSNKTRTHALKLCRRFATGGQKSIHECWLSEAEYGDLIADLNILIDHNSDKVTSVLLDNRQTVYTLGRAEPPLNPELIVVG